MHLIQFCSLRILVLWFPTGAFAWNRGSDYVENCVCVWLHAHIYLSISLSLSFLSVCIYIRDEQSPEVP